MRSTDFCFPLFSTTSTRATFVPSISSRLAPRPFAAGLVPWMMETGGPGGSRRPIRFGGWPPVGARRSSSACSRNHRTSDTPVADPWLPLRLREVRRPPSPPDRALQAVHEDPPTTTIRSAFHRQLSRAKRGPYPPSKKRSREFPLQRGYQCLFTRGHILSYMGPRARRPSLNVLQIG